MNLIKLHYTKLIHRNLSHSYTIITKEGKKSISHCNNNKYLGINLIFLLLQWDEAGASLVVQMIKNLLSVQETQIWSLGQEDPLEKGMAIHPSILAWRISWRKEPLRPQSMGLQRVGHDWGTNTSRFTFRDKSTKGCKRPVLREL